MISVFQAPYLIYVEVLDCDNKHSSPLPAKILENTLRYTRSEENLSGYFRAESGPATHTPPNNIYPVYHMNDSDHDCWSQEDDDILQVCWQIFSNDICDILDKNQIDAAWFALWTFNKAYLHGTPFGTLRIGLPPPPRKKIIFDRTLCKKYSCYSK